MIEFKLNIDISDRLEDAVKALADALVMREKLRHEYAQVLERVIVSQTPDEQREGGPEKTPAPAESEPAKESESQGVSDEAKAEEAPETTRPSQPAKGEKPQKKAREKAQKPAQVTPEPEKAPEPTDVTPEPTDVTPEPEKAPEPTEPEKAPEPTDVTPEPEKAPEPTDVTPEPTDVTPEPEKAPEPTEPEKAPEPTDVTPEKAQEAVKNEDPMQGMNLMQAVKAIVDEIRERGVEMADVNARVRRRANELGLSYSSFTCLVKAIGYTEARRVALGE